MTADTARLRALHVALPHTAEVHAHCVVCNEPWPCETVALLDRLERAEAALGAITLAVGDRTFLLNDDGVTRTVVQFGTGELISATTGRPLGPDEFAVSGISTTDPLVAALARAIELVGPDRISLGHTLPPRAVLAASEPPAHKRTFPNVAFDADEDGSQDAWCRCGNPWPCPLAEPPALEEAPVSSETYDEADGMCPNCVTPWKCNGPHLSKQTPRSLRAILEERP